MHFHFKATFLLIKTGTSGSKKLSTGVIVAIAVSSFVVGSCVLYLILPLIGYALYRLKKLLCHHLWKSFEDYQNEKAKLITEVDLTTKKEPPTDFI